MADTRRLAALKALASTLDGVGKPSDLTVHRFGFRAIEKDSLPSFVVEHGGGTGINREVDDLTENTDVFRVSCHCIGNQSDPPDDVIDPYLSWLVSSIEADLTLGGVVNVVTLRPMGATESIEADRIYIRVVQEIEVQYYHLRTDPESAS